MRYFSVSVYAKHPRVVDSVVGGSVVLMNLDNMDYFALNEVATRVWEIIGDKPSSREDIVSVLLEEFDVDEQTCVSEMDAFLGTSLEQGFLTTQ
jgi:hypothetical protein